MVPTKRFQKLTASSSAICTCAGSRCRRSPGAGEVVAVTELVRICPVCDAENAPQRARCTCGASLLGIDFSLPQAAAADPDLHEPAAAVVQPDAPPPSDDVDPLAGLFCLMVPRPP